MHSHSLPDIRARVACLAVLLLAGIIIGAWYVHLVASVPTPPGFWQPTY